jgi:transposase
MEMRDELGAIYRDEAFRHLFPKRGQPAETPWRLALITVMQFAEGLSDRQAADAVRGRIDWKYALSLELDDPGFDSSVLSEFRTRLIEGGEGQLLLDTLLTRFRELGLLKARGRQRTDSTHVLAKVRALNRYELVAGTLRHALNALATAAPDWLLVHAEPDWVERYERRAAEDRIPSKQEERQALAEAIGADGARLLDAIYAADAPYWLREVPAVKTLRRVWVQNYYRAEDGIRWGTEEQGIPPSSLFLSSPYDPDAHYARKRTTRWVGYKAHLTETCDDELPHLIAHVETTPAPTADGDVTPEVHRSLEVKELLPAIHVVDTGYLDAKLIVDSREEYGVDLLGPTRGDYHWQSREGTGFDAQHFEIDWEKQLATCPEGHTSISWTPAVDKRTNDVIKVKFSTADCRHCPSRDLCVRSKKRYIRRTITIRPKEQYEALQARRERENTPQYRREYAKRAGIEGTISRSTRSCGLRRSRYIGLAKVQPEHVLTAAGLNLLRAGEWFSGITRPETRSSPFVTLMAQPTTA